MGQNASFRKLKVRPVQYGSEGWWFHNDSLLRTLY